MATYYELLGVDPEADHDEVKRAYLTLALRYHPDRQDSATPDALELAQWRMREINEAWAVLQSPGQRAAYDRDLASQQRETVPGRGRVDGGVRADVVEPEPEPVAPGHAPTVSPSRRGPRSGVSPFVPLIVLGVLLLGVIVVTAYAAPGEPEVDVRTSDGFDPGNCVEYFTDRTAEVVPCSGPNTGRVVTFAPYPLSCPPASVRAPLEDGDALCLEET